MTDEGASFMTQNLTTPGIDRPWLKYYSEEIIHARLPEMTMYQYIWEKNRDYLSDAAFRYYGARITYGGLFEQIWKAASAFYAHGVRPGDIVTIMSMHTPETIACIYALNYIGAVANLVYVTLSEKEILLTLQSTKSKMFFALDAALERVNRIQDDLHVPVVILGVSDSMPWYMKLGYRLKVKPAGHRYMTFQDFLKKGEPTLPPMAVDHTAPAVIIYTSGTTGEPKGIVHTNDSLNAQAFQEGNSGFGIRRGARFLNAIPMFLGYGMSKMHLAVSSGIDSWLWIVPDPDSMADQLFKCRPNIYVTGPALIDHVLNHPNGNLKPLYCLIGGGADMPAEKEEQLNRKLRECGASAIYANGYGMTETDASLTASRNDVHKPGSIGIPLFKTNIRVISPEDGRELSFNEVGELWFSTPSLMKCYYNNPEATAAVISTDRDGVRWIHTGDLGCIDEEGFVFIRGRIKRIFPTKSVDGIVYKLSPQLIEDTLNAVPFVEKCAALVREDPQRLHMARAYVTVKTDTAGETGQLLSMLTETVQRELPAYEHPEVIQIIETIPMAPSGKIDYRALEKLVEEME